MYRLLLINVASIVRVLSPQAYARNTGFNFCSTKLSLFFAFFSEVPLSSHFYTSDPVVRSFLFPAVCYKIIHDNSVEYISRTSVQNDNNNTNSLETIIIIIIILIAMNQPTRKYLHFFLTTHFVASNLKYYFTCN